MIDVSASTGLVDVRVNMDVPPLLEVGHSIEIQAFCTFDTFAVDEMTLRCIAQLVSSGCCEPDSPEQPALTFFDVPLAG